MISDISINIETVSISDIPIVERYILPTIMYSTFSKEINLSTEKDQPYNIRLIWWKWCIKFHWRYSYVRP